MGKQACRPRYIAAISPLYLACFPPVSPLTRHHVAARGHQRAAQGGVLRATVEEYLQYWGYEYYAGRDNAGQSGALLVLAWE